MDGIVSLGFAKSWRHNLDTFLSSSNQKLKIDLYIGFVNSQGIILCHYNCFWWYPLLPQTEPNKLFTNADISSFYLNLSLLNIFLLIINTGLYIVFSVYIFILHKNCRMCNQQSWLNNLRYCREIHKFRLTDLLIIEVLEI